MRNLIFILCLLSVSFSATAKPKEAAKLPEQTVAETEGLTDVIEPPKAPSLPADGADAGEAESINLTPTTTQVSSPVVETAPALQTAKNPEQTTTITVETNAAAGAAALSTSELSRVPVAPKPSPTPLTPETANLETVEVVAIGHKPEFHPKSRLSLGFGYVDSRWSKITDKLKDGSFYMSLGLAKEFFEGFELGISIQNTQGTADSSNQENVRAWLMSIDGRYFFSSGHIRPYFGLGLGFGAYRVWNLNNETDTFITYNKHGSGTLVGAIPQVGFRFQLSDRFSADLNGGWAFYMNNPANKIGGWNAGVTLGFSR